MPLKYKKSIKICLQTSHESQRKLQVPQFVNTEFNYLTNLNYNKNASRYASKTDDQ